MLLSLLLLLAPVPEAPDSTPPVALASAPAPCDVIEWTPDGADRRVPCVLPAIPSWPIDEAGVADDVARQVCWLGGDLVLSLGEDGRQLCYGSTYTAPCLREPRTVVWFDGRWWGGEPSRCDTRWELVPDGSIVVPFGDGDLRFEVMA